MKETRLILLIAIHFIFHPIGYGQKLSKQVAAYVEIQDSIVALKNVTLIDGTGGAVKYNQDILLRNNKISAIGNTGKLSLPENTKIVDATGKTVIPGLIMMHEHLFTAKPFNRNYRPYTWPIPFPSYIWQVELPPCEQGGVEANADLNIKNLIDQGRAVGPTIDVSTPHIERTGFIPQLQSLYGDESIENWLNYCLIKASLL